MPTLRVHMVDPKAEWVDRVRAAMASREISVRGLARLMAEKDGVVVSDSAIESRRRKVNKWLSLEEETLPDEAGQRDLGEILGANLRVRRETTGARILRRLAELEDALDALHEGQETAFEHFRELRELIEAQTRMLDERLPGQPDDRRQQAQ